MANDYFNASTSLTQHTLARSEQVNSIFQSVAAGLDKLPGADPLNQGRVTYVADTGAADAYVVSLSKAPSAYTAGLSIVMKASATNTGASTINVNALGVKTIKRYNGDDTVANDIVSGALIHLAYDGSNFRIVGANGAESALAKEWATSTTVVSGGLKGAKGYAQDASTSASNAESHLDTFQGIFYGALASDPATDPNGDPPDAGDWYFNTSSNSPRQYNGAGWDDFGAAKLVTFVFTAAGGETSLSGADDDGNTLAYTAGFVQVHLHGVLLTPDDEYTATNGTSITGLDPLTAGDVVVIQAFSNLAISDAILKSDLSDNEVLAKVGSANPSGLAIGTNELVGRAASGSLKAMTAQEVRDLASKGPTVQVFTSSGTWTKPSGCKFALIEAQGAGGAGGGAESTTTGEVSSGAGGLAGAYARKLLDVSAVSSLSVTVGSGGSGNSGAAGSDGINSGVDVGGANEVSAGGGAGGDAIGASTTTYISQADNGLSAAASTSGGDFAGGTGGGAGACFGFPSDSEAIGGNGGNSYFGGGAIAPRFTAGGSGKNGTAPGAGGSGAYTIEDGTARAGGNGADGIVVITEFY